MTSIWYTLRDQKRWCYGVVLQRLLDIDMPKRPIRVHSFSHLCSKIIKRIDGIIRWRWAAQAKMEASLGLGICGTDFICPDDLDLQSELHETRERKGEQVDKLWAKNIDRKNKSL